MLVRPGRRDAQVIGFYVGRVVGGLALLQTLPLVLAIVLGHWNDATSLVIGIALAVTLSRLTAWRLVTSEDLDWSHGLVTVALAWLVGTAVMAVPMYLSGHFGAFVDAYFEMMSGFTATGLTVLQDLDHLSPSMNLARHLTHFVGGQGIIIVMLVGLGSSSGQVSTLYVGEGRDDRIVPNIVRTAKFIWTVAAFYLVLGTLALWITAMVAGLPVWRALQHAANLFMAAFDTGGFATMSTSVAYYHSLGVELVLVVLMIAGALSFLVHHELWRGRARTVLESLETRTFAVTGAIVTALLLLGLARAGTFTDAQSLLRKGVFSIVSAHTSTGFTVNASRQFVTDWGLVAPAVLLLGLALGGMASSTAGGVKAIRIGLVAKSVARDIRRAIQPDAAVVVASFRKRQRRVITDAHVHQAITILVLYLASFLLGALLGVYYGYPFDQALFESTSASVNGGMSVGVLDPTRTPLPLKLVYTVQMWLGRLEFMAVFALGGYLVAAVRGR